MRFSHIYWNPEPWPSDFLTTGRRSRQVHLLLAAGFFMALVAGFLTTLAPCFFFGKSCGTLLGRKPSLRKPKMSISQDAEKNIWFFWFEIKSRQLALLYIVTKKLPRNVRASSSSFKFLFFLGSLHTWGLLKNLFQGQPFDEWPQFSSSSLHCNLARAQNHHLTSSCCITKCHERIQNLQGSKKCTDAFCLFSAGTPPKIVFFFSGPHKKIGFQRAHRSKKKLFSAGTPLKNKFVFSGHTAQK